jgi:AcrR family transcriptional regulator
MPLTVRPARADAQRNRRLLLDAAIAAFAEQGVDVPVREIARRAGVGKGTFFRHFPTKEALVEAIIGERLEQLRTVAAEANAAGGSGWDALRHYLESATAFAIADRSFIEAVHPADLPRAAIGAAVRELQAELTALLARGRGDGSVRDDVTAEDLQFLVHAVAANAARMQTIRPDLWRRNLVLLLDSLRPQGASQLPVPALTGRQLAAAGEACG